MRPFDRPEILTADHDVSRFDSGSEAQTVWLRRYAFQAQQADAARVYVAREAGTRRVAGYYALAAGSVAHDSAAPRITRGLGRYPVPVVVLTRLAVDVTQQGRGLGASLVQDALLQTALIADQIGVRALLIHAETQQAAAFYRRLSPAFVESPSDPMDLILLLKDLRSGLRYAAKRPIRGG
jgi:ribosomal protein S18 acetylase RimI-like enzyme